MTLREEGNCFCLENDKIKGRGACNYLAGEETFKKTHPMYKTVKSDSERFVVSVQICKFLPM